MKSKYRCRVFSIDGVECSWQFMEDREGPVYCRHACSFAVPRSVESRITKEIRVPRPEMTAEEKELADNLFRKMKTSKERQRKIISILTEDRWDKAVEEMGEKLAKADWEKYGKGKCA